MAFLAVPPPLWPATRAVAAQFLASGVFIGVWAANIPFVQARFDLEDDQIGRLLLAAALGAVTAMTLAGWCSRWVRARPLSIFTAVLTPFALLGLYLTPDYAMVIALLAVIGAGIGALDVAMNGLAAVLERESRRTIMSGFHACYSIGALLGAVFAAGAIWMGVGPAAQTGVVLVVWLAVFARLWRALPDDDPAPVEGAPAREFALTPRLAILGLACSAAFAAEGAVADWSALYLRDYADAAPSAAALGFAALSATMIIGRMTGDSLTDRFGARRMIAIGGALAAAGMTLTLLAPAIPLKLAGFALAGAGLANLAPVIFSAAARTPGVRPSAGVAFIAVCGYGGFLIAPPLIGELAEAYGLDRALWLLVGAGVFILAASAAFDRRRTSEAGAVSG